MLVDRQKMCSRLDSMAAMATRSSGPAFLCSLFCRHRPSTASSQCSSILAKEAPLCLKILVACSECSTAVLNKLYRFYLEYYYIEDMIQLYYFELLRRYMYTVHVFNS